MEFVDYKCLESLLIEGEEIAQEGILKTAGKVVGGTIGAILATYAATILGIVLISKAEDKSNQNSYARKTGVNKSELSNDIKVILGGGDTVAASKTLGYKDSVAFASTGGGAALEFVSGKNLPGIDVIDNK